MADIEHRALLYQVIEGYAPGISDERVIEIAANFQYLEVDENTEIIRQDEPGNAMFIIASGEVEITRSPWGRGSAIPPHHVAVLKAGDLVGEMALVLKQRRTANARTLTPVSLYELSRDGLIHIQAQFPVFADRVERIARQRAEQLQTGSDT